MKSIIFFTFFLISTELTAQSYLDSSVFFEKNFITREEFLKAQNDLEEQIEIEERRNDRALEGISKQLDAASYTLTIFSILFGITAISLGLYVTYVERKIVRISEENKELLLKNQKIKKEVEDLNTLIQRDVYSLFLKIKREETAHIIDRLVKIPKDIANVNNILLSQELLEIDFPKIKQAFDNLGSNDHKFKHWYYPIFFQHFLNQVMRDEKLRKEIVDIIPLAIQASFENDIIKSTTDFMNSIIDQGIHNFTLELNQYFIGLSNSHHKNIIDVYKIIFETLHSRKNRFELFLLIDSIAETRTAKIDYGELLISEYDNDSATESEKLIFEEVQLLKNQATKEMEDIVQKQNEHLTKQTEKNKKNKM